MKCFKPAYYDQFRCLAAACPDSCCKEWDVQVDPASAACYRSLNGPLGDRLRQVLTEDPEAGTLMTIENGRCPMWRDDGLCRIQSELGHSALCKTCREFPRLTHDYGDFVELGLELSCPEAARLMLTSPADALLEATLPGGEAPEYDTAAMALLLQSRTQALALLADPRYAVPQALALLLFYSADAQSRLDGLETPDFDPEMCLSQAYRHAAAADLAALPRFFSALELLTDAWPRRLQSIAPGPWENVHRALARCLVERYWLQAVSDYDLSCRVKMIVASCILIRSLGGDPIATAQLWSKEVENDADNMDALLDAAYTHAAFADDKLLGLLLK